MSRGVSALPPTLAPRFVNREQAAAYLCVSPPKFDQMVKDGRMPRPRCIDRRRVWCVRELDAKADAIPVDGGEPSDESWSDFDAA